jgi:hypothetical protein
MIKKIQSVEVSIFIDMVFITDVSTFLMEACNVELSYKGSIYYQYRRHKDFQLEQIEEECYQDQCHQFREEDLS